MENYEVFLDDEVVTKAKNYLYWDCLLPYHILEKKVQSMKAKKIYRMDMNLTGSLQIKGMEKDILRTVEYQGKAAIEFLNSKHEEELAEQAGQMKKIFSRSPLIKHIIGIKRSNITKFVETAFTYIEKSNSFKAKAVLQQFLNKSEFDSRVPEAHRRYIQDIIDLLSSVNTREEPIYYSLKMN